MPNWEDVKRIFHEAADLPPAEQGGFLSQACGDDHELRGEVESLLRSASGERTWRSPAPDLASELWSELAQQEVIGRAVGGYRLVELIAAGGMGAVYRAERADGQTNRTVAIKLIRPGLCTPEMNRRFARELQTVATLEHPGVARLIDGGVADEGLPYLVLEFVDGRPIDRFSDEAALSINDRLRLFRRVCEAVEFAHRHLIVHRDLKPKNILVNAQGEPKLLDFGIAKLLSAEETAPADVTATLQRVMTPQYASPEQMRGEPVTTATDVYSLGVVLYELLTGHQPYHIKKDNLHDAYRIISDSTPHTPSEAITQVIEIEGPDGTTTTITPELVSRVRGEIPARLRRRLRGDLDTIVMTAMHKDAARRYTSVEQLSEDISRYLRGLPIRAHRDTLRYRAERFIARNKPVCAAAVLVFVALCLGAGGIAVGFFRAHEALRREEEYSRVARLEALRAHQVNAFLTDLISAADPWKRGRTTVREVLEVASNRLEAELSQAPELRAGLHNTIGAAYAGLGDFATAEPHLTKAIELHQAAGGASALELATALNNMGSLFATRHDYSGALPYHQKSLAIRKSHLGPIDPAVLRTEMGVANDLAAMGELVRAEEMMQRVLTSQRQFSSQYDVAATLNNLAFVQEKLGKMEEAVASYRSCLEIYAQLPDETPAQAAAMHNLAGRMLARGDLPAAEELYGKALELKRQFLGAEHPILADTLADLALVFLAQGRLDEAENHLRDALRIRESTLGPEHSLYGDALAKLARTKQKQGDCESATVMFQKSLEIARKADDKVALEDRLERYGSQQFQCVFYQQAEELFREALDLCRSRQGDTHPDVLRISNNLAGTLAEQFKYDEASQLILGTYAAAKNKWGEKHSVPGLYRRNLLEIKLKQHYFDQALAFCHASSSADLVADCLRTLGELFMDIEEYAEAEKVLLSASVLDASSAALNQPLLVRLYELWEKPELAARYRAIIENGTPFRNER